MKNIAILFSSIILLYGSYQFLFPNKEKTVNVTWNELYSIFQSRIPSEYGQSGTFDGIFFNDSLVQIEEVCNNCPFNISFSGWWFNNKANIYLLDTSFQNQNRLRNDTFSIIYHSSAFGFPIGKYQLNLAINAECDTISKIVFNEIIEQFSRNNRSTLNKQSQDKRINVNMLFDSLTNNTLKPWISSLDDVDTLNNNCVEIFKLLKYLKSDQKSGYGDSEYNLTLGIQSYLNNMVFTLKQYLDNYQEGQNKVKITFIGYADKRPFGKGLYKNYNRTSILYDAQNCPVNISNSNLRSINDSLINNTGLLSIPNRIHNNCQLSTARAYEAMDYVRNKLSSYSNIEFFYTGAGKVNDVNYNKARKVNVEIIFDGAK